ncbi:MAG: PIN domain-containing protein [Planctomycetes bacterium]|nr:PIN domain-containing protein [Planctomycetota bacterium]
MAFTAEIAESAAYFRASYKLRTPDAIQVATAIAMKAEYFLTNDFALADIPHLTILVMEKLTD